jgi:hypothetical protein
MGEGLRQPSRVPVEASHSLQFVRFGCRVDVTCALRRPLWIRCGRVANRARPVGAAAALLDRLTVRHNGPWSMQVGSDAALTCLPRSQLSKKKETLCHPVRFAGSAKSAAI